MSHGSHGFDGRYENQSRNEVERGGLRETLTRGGYEHSGSFSQFRPVQSAGVDIHLPGVSIDFGTGQRYGGSYYNQNPYGGSYYNQNPYGGSYYNQNPYGGSYYNQNPYGGSYYNQNPYSGSYYNQNPYGGSYYNQNPYGGSYYNNPHRPQHHGGNGGGGLQFNFGFGGRHHR